MSFFDRFRNYPELKRVIVNLKSGTVFNGVVYRRRSDVVILKNAKILQDRGAKTQNQDIDGELLLFVGDIDFIQVI